MSAGIGLNHELRPVKLSDWPEWNRLWQNYLTFYRTKLSDETTRITFARFLDPSIPVYCAVAEAKGADGKPTGRLVGMVQWIYHYTNWSSSHICYLQDLFVDEDVRASGLGSALIKHVASDAQKRGALRVYWNTHETNSRARQLYDKVAERSGFIQYRLALPVPDERNLRAKL